MYRVGQSTDIHRLDNNLPLIIGGINIEHSKGIVAHSDGDILVHAITESIIGALGLGDLGTFFDDNNEVNENRSSLEMLAIINDLLRSKKFEVVNIDSLIMIEEPKIKPYVELMKKNIDSILNIGMSRINIKATRGEKLGYIGRMEGVVAQAIVLLKNENRQ